MTFYFDTVALMAEGTCPDCEDEYQNIKRTPTDDFEFLCDVCSFYELIPEEMMERAMSNVDAEGDDYLGNL